MVIGEIVFKKFNIIENATGNLISLEKGNLPFPIKRVYYIYNVKENESRGFHAHRQLEQVLICVKGSCDVLVNNGHAKKVIKLDDPSTGLYLKGLVWREMHNFSSDAVLLVLASDFYSESDYIRDYSDFLDLVTNS